MFKKMLVVAALTLSVQGFAEDSFNHNGGGHAGYCAHSYPNGSERLDYNWSCWNDFNCKDGDHGSRDYCVFNGGNSGGHDEWGTCWYWNKQTQRSQNWDYYGNHKSCKKGERWNWYDTCRDGRDETDETGCW